MPPICSSSLTRSHEFALLNSLKEKKGFPFSDMLRKEEIEETLPKNQLSRERIFSPSIVVWSFLSQAIEEDKSQQTAVLRVIAHYMEQGKKPPSGNTSAYSQARSKLPENCLPQLCRKIAKELGTTTADASKHLWKGHRIKLVDGSSLSMPDTPANQASYPQSPRQKKGLGFPSMRIVAVIDYMTGALLDLAGKAAYGGKETGEHALLRELIHRFDKNDLMIGDRYYPSFFLMATLLEQGISGVFPQHGSRNTDFRRGKSLGRKDHLIQWTKPKKPEWMEQAEYDVFPEKITVREVAIEINRPGFRSKKDVLVTTLDDPTEVTVDDLIEIYGRRWFAEISFYSIKETMKMGILRGKTPAMVRKEIWAHLLAYNLIRKIMWSNAQLQGLKVPEQSFKLALQALRILYQSGLNLINSCDFLSLVLAYKQVANRPNRQEPRAVKRRPKRFPRLQKPRELYKNAA